MLAQTKWWLQAALLSWVEERRRGSARRFLDGLSLDELEYIAAFLGTCVLECHQICRSTHAQLTDWIRQFDAANEAAGDKPLLVYEYLRRSGR